MPAALRIGTSLTTSYGTTSHPREGAAAVVAAARAASDAGLDSLFVGDHHSTGPDIYYQNVPIIGRLLADWRGPRAGLLALLPLWSPVLLAEQLGTLAALTDARVVLQCSLGDDPAQFAAFGIDPSRRVPLFERCLASVQALLRGDTVGGVHIAPVPDHVVECWVGAMAPAGIDRAARLADGWLASPGAPLSLLRDRANHYVDACARYDRPPSAVAVRRDIYVGETDAHAEAMTTPLLARGYRGMTNAELVIGSPDTVASRFAELAALGFTDVIVRHMSVPAADVVASTARLRLVSELLAS